MIRKLILNISACFALVLLLGAAFQWNGERLDRKSIPGELVSVGEHEFHLLCRGTGSPLLLLENGLWGSYPDWLYTIEGLSTDTRVCAYDRLGMGWSSANAVPTRASDVARHLHDLLLAADLYEPMILVGFSAGGLYVREYYNQFPEKVAGMLLIDSSHEQQANRMEHVSNDLSLETFCTVVAWTGVGRFFKLFDGFVEKSFSPERHAEQLRAYHRTNFCDGLILQTEGMEQDLFMDMQPRSLGELPLVVLAAGKPLREQIPSGAVPEEFLKEHETVWPQLQLELSALSTNSTHASVRDSGHAIQLEQPEVVIDALKGMVRAYRAESSAL